MPVHVSGGGNKQESISFESSDKAVGLSDVNSAQNRREMLELVNRLHDTGVQTDIDLPMIAVIGNQSAGKSSLIESISGITLPRSSGTCTRCPTECKLSHSDAPWKCAVKLHFSTDVHGAPIPVRLVTFGDPISSPSLVEDRIRRAQHAILNPSTDPQVYLEDDDVPNKNEVSFSKNYVSLEISGSDLADLSFVDLPGLIASVGCGGSERDIELVKSLVTSYIEKPSCVILLTVTCETDFENQGAYHLAKCFDQHGKRTVGVLTKPDRIPLGDEAAWVKMIQNFTEPLVNNWYCVKQPSSKDIASGITWADAREQEAEFFAMTQPVAFIGSLSRRETERRTSELPRAPSGDPVTEVLKALNDFSRDFSRRVEGTPEDGLLQAIRKHQNAFRRAIHLTVPNYVPYETNAKKNDDPSFPKPEFLANEGDNEEDEDLPGEGNNLNPKNFLLDAKLTGGQNEDSPATKKRRTDGNQIYVDEVLDRAENARTRELPDNYPFIVQKAYIQEFTKEWDLPATHLFESVYTTLKTDLRTLVEAHFAHLGQGAVKQSVLMIVYEHLDEAATRAKSMIQWLLAIEQVPATLNTHYFADYKDKFLAHYRACRSDSMARVPSSVSTNSNQDPITKILSGLSEIGIHVKAADLPKLLPPDPMEVALDIMASVRAYFKSTAPEQPPPPPPATSTTRSSLPSLDIDPAKRLDQAERTERTGAKSSKDSLSSIERRRRFLARTSLGILAIAVGVQVLYLGREWEADELASKKVKIEDAPSGRWARTKERFADMFDYFNKPAWTELLPPPLPSPHQKPYTLLVSMDDLLITSIWDRQKGWRTAKRPGVDYFLAYLSQFYEIVIFTTQNHYTAVPIIEKLDPYNFFVTYKLFRDATRSVDGKIVKDLSYLNRDLSKVILLDTHEEHTSTHPENSIVLPKWTGTPGDKGLVAMIPFLESIGIYKPQDVRPILEAYRGKDIPVEYGKKEADARERHIAEWKGKSKGLSSSGFTMSSLFGVSTESSHSPIPPTYLEQKRTEAQRQYKEEQAYIASHKAEFDKLLEDDRQAMAKEMPGSLLGVLDTMSGKKKPQAEESADKTTAGGGEGQVKY
ncbi:hypothetical protein JVU11DRAFT_11711 [Chiua virens]|nr:hypothetical protein JVU11DRAFT_11711 [Chiua virens]